MADKNEIQSWQIQLAQLTKSMEELWDDLQEAESLAKATPEARKSAACLERWYTVELEVECLAQKIKFHSIQLAEQPQTPKSE